MLQKECNQAAKFQKIKPNFYLHFSTITTKQKFTYKSSAGKYSHGLANLKRNGTGGNSSGYINTLLWQIKFKIRS